MDPSINKRQFRFAYLLLIAATLAVYWQVIGFDFINFDDNCYVVENPSIQKGLSLDGIKWAFTACYHATWQPMIWLSYMLDYEIAGLNPWIYHLTNLLFHLANTLLLFIIMNRMCGQACLRQCSLLFIRCMWSLLPGLQSARMS